MTKRSIRSSSMVLVWLGLLFLFGFLPLSRQDVSGCYDLELGALSLPEPTRHAFREVPLPDSASLYSIFWGPPARVRFTQEQWMNTEWFRYEIPAGSPQIRHNRLLWRESGDRLTFSYSDGLNGGTAELGWVQSEWQGTLRRFTDDGGRFPHVQRLVLRPVPCDSAPPLGVPAEPIPRVVELDTGSAIELGRPIPEGATVRRQSSGWVIIGAAPVGIFAGADTLRVRPDLSGRVTEIQLRYPATFDLDDLVRRVEVEFGLHLRDSDFGVYFLLGRTTDISLRSIQGDRPFHRITLSDPRISR